MLSVKGQFLTFKIAPVKVPILERRATMEFYVNDEFIDRITFDKKEWRKISLDLSRYRPSELIRFEIVCTTRGLRAVVKPFNWVYASDSSIHKGFD